MSEFLHRLFDLLGPDYLIGKVVGILATLAAGVELVRRTYPLLRQRVFLLLKSWRIKQLDEISKQLVETETKYIAAFLKHLESKKWDPLRYVRPRLDLEERRLEPVDPILLLLEGVGHRESPSEETLLERRETLRRQRVRDLLGVAKRFGGLVILGDPGSGKTTCLLQLAIEVANRALYSPHFSPLLPIFLPLNEFTDDLPSHNPQDGVLAFVMHQIRQQVASMNGADISARLQSLVREGRIAFLFDALDEMPRDGYPDRFRALSKFAKACASANKNNIFVFSCRKLDYVDDPTFPAQQVLLSPFSARQIKAFFRKHLQAHTSTAMQVPTPNADFAMQLRSPFFLSLMSACLNAGVDPGQTWDVLIMNYVQVALDAERKRRGHDRDEWQPLLDRTMTWLSKFAFELVRSRATGTKADSGMVTASLANSGENDQVVDVAESAGIIRQLTAGAIRFEHHRLQEYFAARYLADLLDTNRESVYAYLDDIWWHEVVLMTAGLMNHPNHLINEILDAADEIQFTSFSDVRTDFSRVMTAMACYRPAYSKLDMNTRSRLADYLVQFLQYGNILQQVRALRIVPNFVDRIDVFVTARRMLQHPSKWVRQTALSIVAEISTVRGGATAALHDSVRSMTKTEVLLVQTLQDFPFLFRRGTTMRLVPMYLLFVLFGFFKVSWLWLLYCLALFLSERGHISSLRGYLGSVGLPVAIYLLIWILKKRGYISGFWLGKWSVTKSLNTWMVFFVLWGIFWNLAIGIVSNIGHPLKALGGTSIGDLVVLLVFVLIINLYIRGLFHLYLLWRERHRKKIDVALLVPASSIKGRSKQAKRLLGLARQEADAVARDRLIDAIRRFLPVERDVLSELEEFCEWESNIDIRSRAFQVYEQIELSLDREGFGPAQAN